MSARTCKLILPLLLSSLSRRTEGALFLLPGYLLVPQLTPHRVFPQLAIFLVSPASLPPHILHIAHHYIRTALVLIAVVALIGPLRKSAQMAPAHARARVSNAGICAVHFGIDNAGRDGQHNMRDLSRDMDLDMVGPLETDLHVCRRSLGSFEASGWFQAPLILLRYVVADSHAKRRECLHAPINDQELPLRGS